VRGEEAGRELVGLRVLAGAVERLDADLGRLLRERAAGIVRVVATGPRRRCPT